MSRVTAARETAAKHKEVVDLRTALDLLAATPGELLITDEPVDADGELAAVYPSQSPDFSPFLRAQGTSCKTIFDCTVPYDLRERFRRPPFREVDVARFLPGDKQDR